MMVKKIPAYFFEYFSNHRIVLLLGAILVMIIGSPFLYDIFHYRFIPDLFLTIIFVFGIYAISHKKRNIYIALSLAIPMFAGIWSSHLYQTLQPLAVGHLFGVLFVGFIISLLIKFIFNEKQVTTELIYAAVVVYLLMALMWAFAYSILNYFYPGSFSISEGATRDTFQYIYFSFVTITTLGYGDVAPLTQKASSLAILEAVTGQIYLVVVVAWLVGMHVSGRSRN
jgi:voltage-gated potassium channel